MEGSLSQQVQGRKMKINGPVFNRLSLSGRLFAARRRNLCKCDLEVQKRGSKMTFVLLDSWRAKG